MFNRKFSLCVLMSIIFTFCGCTPSENIPEDKPLGTNAVYDIFGDNKIPVGMWYTPPDNYRSDDAFKKIAECGITMVNGFGYCEDTDAEIKDVLKYCEKYNLKYLFNSLDIEKNIRRYAEDGNKKHIEDTMALINKYADHPAYYGQLFLDEPSGKYFDSLKDFIGEFRKQHPDKLPYVNMLPYYALGGTGFSSYDLFVDTWMEKINPPMFSYDSYPCIDYDPSYPGFKSEMSDYYYNLDLLRVKTLEKSIPLWSFIASEGYISSGGEPTRRTPSREDLRWQVFSNLAFGSKGIQYWCYWTPGQDTTGEALVDRGGVPTERYYYAQEVNKEFQKYGSILLNSDAVGVMMSDKRRNGFNLYTMPLEKFGKIRKIEGNRYVAGCFSDKDTGKKSMLITATTPRDNIELKIYMYKSIQNVTAYVKGEKTTLDVKNGILDLSVKAGDAVLIQL